MAGPEPIGHRQWLSSPLDDDDHLSEILRRLPPRPSSLPHASLVCKRWRDLAASPQFLRDFRVFHRAAAPLLGFFHNTDLGGPDRRFVAAADPPDRVPAALFRMPWPCGPNHKEWRFLDCRHGRALLIGSVGPRREVLVWDPMTGARRCTPVPPDAGDVRHGAVLCSCGLARDCRSSPLKVVLVWWIGTAQHWRVAAAIYSSESDAWSHVISVETQLAPTVVVTQCNARKPGVLVGDAAYWLLPESRILEFDTGRRSLSLISGPVHSAESPYWQSHLVLTEAKELGAMFMVAEVSIELWKRDTGNAAGWSMHRSVRLDKCLPRMPMEATLSLLGFHEESNAIFVWIDAGLFLIQLESMQTRMLCQGVGDFEIYPFSGFYHRDAAGTQADDLLCIRELPIVSVNMWHYEDPSGNLQGPFSMVMLHGWSSYFPEDFKVWRTDETKEQAVLLTDAMQSLPRFGRPGALCS